MDKYIKERIVLLFQQFSLLYQQGQYRQALEVANRLCDLAYDHFGPNHPDYANALSNVALLHHTMDNYEVAGKLYNQVLEICQKSQKERSRELATCLNNLARLHDDMGDYRIAKSLFLQALEIRSEIFGEEHPEVAEILENLGGLYWHIGDYRVAEQHFCQALEIHRKIFGEKHPNFAQSLNNLGLLEQDLGRYEAAEKDFFQAVEIRRKILGVEHPDLSVSLNNLATLYMDMGKYQIAEPMFRQSLRIRCSVFGENSLPVAIVLNNMARLYHNMGNYGDAESLFLQSLEIRQRVLGKEHPSTATALDNIALLYQDMGRTEDAESLFRQAMDIRRKTLSEGHPEFAASLNNLAAFYCRISRYEAAEQLFQQAIESQIRIFGESLPGSLSNLAMLYRDMGKYPVAEQLFKQAMEAFCKIHSEKHPGFAAILNNLAVLYVATSREVEALELMQQSAAIDDDIMGQVFSIGSERQRMAYIRRIWNNFDAFLSLVYQYLAKEPLAVRSAMDLVLRRKMISTEAFAVQRETVLGGKYLHLEPMLRELAVLRTQIIQKKLEGPGVEGLQAYLQQLAEWNAEKELFEIELAREIPEMNIEQTLRSANQQVVASMLPNDAVLVEFVRFNILDFHAVSNREEIRWKPARYIAFIMSAKEPDSVQMIDLGEAERIDRMIAEFRESITDEPEQRTARGLGELPTTSSIDAIKYKGSELRRVLFDPLMNVIGNRYRLIIVPDGDLSRLPFEVLSTDDGRYLIDHYHI